MNPNYTNPAAFSPMPQQEFEQRLAAQMQNLSLQDPQEIREISKFNREMAREAQKSMLRQAEFQAKQVAKQKTSQIVVMGELVLLQKVNGRGELLAQNVLFCCRVEEVRRYRRGNEILWQIVLVEAGGKSRLASELYSDEVLQSETKLRRTVLSCYDKTVDAGDRSSAWKWARVLLLELLEQSEVIELPSKAGWHEFRGRWHFWTAEDKEAMLLNEQIRQCHVQLFDALDAEKVIASLLETGKSFTSKGQAAALLILRLSALLGMLTGKPPQYFGTVLIGEGAGILAKDLLCTFQTDANIVNLDSDRLGRVKEQVKGMQDNPMVFLSSDPDGKSTQNRLRAVLSWLESGYIEGTQSTIPFVFCFRQFSKNYPLDGMLVFETDGMLDGYDGSLFAKFQQLVVESIEANSGYWADRIKKVFGNFSAEAGKNEKLLVLPRTITSVVLDMFREDLTNKTFTEFKYFLGYGEQEISKQLLNHGQLLVELFQEQVQKMVEDGLLLVLEKEYVPYALDEKSVYFDTECYYFTKAVLQRICGQMKIDNKSLLYLKQSLIEMGCVKLYKTNGYRRRELEVDFTLKYCDGVLKQLSGFAIQKSFWDKPGGIALFERGGE